MDRCKVSIIIPVYNEEKYIEESYRSIKAGSYSDYEIIFIDDGSTDRTLEICNQMAEKDKKITVLHQNNYGPASARNKGMAVAKGEYIVFCDADDTIHKDLLKMMVDICEKKNVDFVMADALRVDIKGQKHCSYWDTEDRLIEQENMINIFKQFLMDERSNRILCSVWGKLFKKSIIEKNQLQFDETLHTSEDELFCFMYLSYVYRIYYIHKNLYTYYRNRNNFGSSSVLKNPLAFEKCLLTVKNYLLQYCPIEELDPLYGNAYCEYAISACYHLVRLTKINSIPIFIGFYNNLKQIINKKEFRNSLKYYQYKNNDNYKAVVFFIKMKMVLFLWITFKIQIYNQMKNK